MVVAVNNNYYFYYQQPQLWGTLSGWSGKDVAWQNPKFWCTFSLIAALGWCMSNTLVTVTWASNPFTLSAFFSTKKWGKSPHSSAPLSPSPNMQRWWSLFFPPLISPLSPSEQEHRPKTHSTESNRLLAWASLVTNCNTNNVDHLANQFIKGSRHGLLCFLLLLSPSLFMK